MRSKAAAKPLQNTAPSLQETRWQTFVRHFKRDWQLYLIILLPAIYVAIFYYGPMYGVQIAFRDYRIKDGITGSKWVGWKWFQKFLNNYEFKAVLRNTLSISFYTIFAGFPLPIIFALLLNSIENPKFKKITQNICYIPHFFSVVVLVAIIRMLFSANSGLYGNIYRALIGSAPPDWRNQAEVFPHLYVWSGVWQNLCWDSIIYTAALSSISPELHEAATLDGATKWQRVLHVDLPGILPTVAIMLILRFGSVMSVGFEKVYLMQSTLNLRVSEVISTYVYKVGMASAKDFSYGSAVGLFNSVINVIMLVTVNWVSKRVSSDEVSMF